MTEYGMVAILFVFRRLAYVQPTDIQGVMDEVFFSAVRRKKGSKSIVDFFLCVNTW